MKFIIEDRIGVSIDTTHFLFFVSTVVEIDRLLYDFVILIFYSFNFVVFV